jgi:two-component system response regulator
MKDEQQSPPFIFVIDDQEADLNLIKRAQMSFCPDCRLLMASSTVEASDYLADPSIIANVDLMILDLKVPGAIQGFEFIELVKATPSAKDIALVIFTSSIAPADEVEARRRGADDYVVKPVDYEEYRQALANVFERWATKHYNPATA